MMGIQWKNYSNKFNIIYGGHFILRKKFPDISLVFPDQLIIIAWPNVIYCI